MAFHDSTALIFDELVDGIMILTEVFVWLSQRSQNFCRAWWSQLWCETARLVPWRMLCNERFIASPFLKFFDVILEEGRG